MKLHERNRKFWLSIVALWKKIKKNQSGRLRKGYHSRNVVTEGNRRNRIKDGLFALRALIPQISKMDRASILGDAISYIKELKEQEKELRDEIRDLEEENCVNSSHLRMTRDKEQLLTKSQAFTEFNQSSSGCIDTNGGASVREPDWQERFLD